MAKLRRSAGKPSPAKRTATKTAVKSKPAAKVVKKSTPAKPKAAPARKAVPKPVAKPVGRPAPRAVAVKAGKAPVKVLAKTPPAKAPVKALAKAPVKAQTPQKPPARSTYAEAVLTYERAMQALQGKRYRDAAHLLKTVIATYPEEKELLERAQLYLRVCERHLTPLDATPSTPEERVYAATLAINSGDLERAVTLLAAAVAQDPSNDHAEYMLGVALAIRGHHDAAIAHLERAVALNPETRNLIAKEADLEALRQTEAIMALLAAPPSQARRDRDRRLAARPKGSAR
jgi:tetratricopeptide (TPR) repeat protein